MKYEVYRLFGHQSRVYMHKQMLILAQLPVVMAELLRITLYSKMVELTMDLSSL